MNDGVSRHFLLALKSRNYSFHGRKEGKEIGAKSVGEPAWNTGEGKGKATSKQKTANNLYPGTQSVLILSPLQHEWHKYSTVIPTMAWTEPWHVTR
jgi:hypothetical protein